MSVNAQIEQDIVPLPGNVKPRRLPALNQLREPRIVNVAGEVAGFDAPMPKTRDKQARGNRQSLRPASPQEIGCGMKS